MNITGYRITKGQIVFILVNDLAESVDLLGAAGHLQGSPRDQQPPFRLSSISRDYLGYKPEPLGLNSLRFTVVPLQGDETAELGNIYLWSSGLVTYELAVRLEKCPLESVHATIARIQASRALESAAFNLSEQIIAELKQFMVRPALKRLAEDFVVVCAEELVANDTALTIDQIDQLTNSENESLSSLREGICGILRPMSTDERPARQEIRDTWEHVYQGVLGNFTVVDFNVAFIYGKRYESILSVLLLVQVQMLTLRELSADLQAKLPDLEASAKSIIGEQTNRKHRWFFRIVNPLVTALKVTLTQFGLMTTPNDRVNKLMLDLHELKAYALTSVELAENLTEHFGDVSLHRLYDACQDCFDFEGLSGKIDTRLKTLDETLSELNSLREHHSSFFWELVVVILITIEVVKSFFGH